jgi:hypothetical protein
VAKPTQTQNSLSAEEWLLLRDSLDPDAQRELSDLLSEHDPSTFDGFSRLSARLGVMVMQMKIPPQVATSAVRMFEMSFTSLLVGQDKHIAPREEGNSILALINVARDTSRRLEERSPIRLIDSDDDES